MVGRWWGKCIIAFLITFPSIARSNTAIAAIIPPVKAGYWYCHSDFPIPVPSIPSQLFTHLFAAFADVKPNTYEVTFPDEYRERFSTFTQSVQNTNKKVKTLLSIGGFSGATFALMASQLSTRKSFIDSSIKLARSNDFHGLSLHWLYPSTAADMTNLGSLLDEWRAAVDKESELTGNDRLLLVAAVNYTSSTSPTVTYPVNQIARKLDWINVVAYDFYNPALSGNRTGPFAALRSPQINAETPPCGHNIVSAWLATTMPANKIVLGLPFYGAVWRLVNENNREIFVAAAGRAQSDKVYINDLDGTLPYNQIKYFIEKHPGGRHDHSDEYVVDYFSAGNTWIGYNDIQSIRAKVEYARGKGLLGYYAWHVGGDRDGTLSGAAFGAWPILGPEQADIGNGTDISIADSTDTGNGTTTGTGTSTSTATGVGTVTGTVTSTITSTNTNTNTFICNNTCLAPTSALASSV
ncbi:class V chitinase-like [Corylus avellana]|uniref:class V chitinase-like n=1 Tax=Corylus avellana TaxID=13451 RepID=UPI001E20A070|nr:class V chitinase-like [Corylus avellana]